MSKELAYTKGVEIIWSREADHYDYHDLYISETKTDEEADFTCRIFNQAPAMYELLKEIRVEIAQRYNSAVADADWHNNNMPNVGQGVDYKPYPPKPKELEKIDEIIKKIEQ